MIFGSDGTSSHRGFLSGHNSRDRSECVNVIGVISEPFVVKGRK